MTVVNITSIILAVATLATAITGFLTLFRKQNETHKLVNSAYTDNVARVDQLTKELTNANLPVPPHEPPIA